MAFETTVTVILYVILGAMLGVIWSLRRIYFLERSIAALDLKIERLLERSVKRKK
ncbi:MAG TPA: hypothetical protein VJG30_04625 [Candidatus Nanoarchaeia archaeon]|nr:hypothetical protein [Candidatus Nanoarchaeia archaeon]